MKREEKNRLTQRKILEAALREFGAKGYEEASLNAVCQTGGVSKGIIYHYFADKDELFLSCARETFRAMAEGLSLDMQSAPPGIDDRLAYYFNARTRFFDRHPHYLRLFCSAVIQPPTHLRARLAACKQPLDRLNLSVLTQLLEQVNLREDVTLNEVAGFFLTYQDLVNSGLQSLDACTLEEHEAACRRWVQILLYGVAAR